MSDKITLSDLSLELEPALAHAFMSYQTFKEQQVPLDAKGFAAYHNACKSALLHIALLMKLLDEKEKPETPDTDWLQLARQSLKGIETNELFVD